MSDSRSSGSAVSIACARGDSRDSRIHGFRIQVRIYNKRGKGNKNIYQVCPERLIIGEGWAEF